MGTLIEQINEMISILEIIDPEAAAKYRGGQPNHPNQLNQPNQVAQLSQAAQTIQPEQYAQTAGVSRPPIVSVLPEPPVIAMGVAPTITNIAPTETEITTTVVEIAPSVSNITPTIAVSPISGEQISDEIVQKDTPERTLTENRLYVKLSGDSLVQGILYSEILGKPVSQRQRRRRI